MLTYLKHIFIITFNFISCFVKTVFKHRKNGVKTKYLNLFIPLKQAISKTIIQQLTIIICYSHESPACFKNTFKSDKFDWHTPMRLSASGEWTERKVSMKNVLINIDGNYDAV